MKKQHFDLTFIGAGLSTCCTIIYYINSAYELKKTNKVTLLVLEKTQEFWAGVPYGIRSGYDSLIITSLKEFLPEGELKLFVHWIKENFHKVISDRGIQNENSPLHEWLLNNQKKIEENLWENLFIPRYLFGNYLKARMTTILKTAANDGIIDYELVTAEVTDIETSGGAHHIKALKDNNNEISFLSTKVVLCVGTPPKAKLDIYSKDKDDQPICLIEDVYEPGINVNMSRVRDILNRKRDRNDNNILLLGSNASALEVVYNLKGLTISENLINHIYILSPDGTFPNKIREIPGITNYIPANLTSLKNAATYTSGQILEAVKKDTEDAHNAEIDISDIYHCMANLVVELLNNLSLDEQEKFVFSDGVEIGKFQRRAGAEYLAAANHLISQHKISFIKGRFIKQALAEPGSFYFEYKDKISEEIRVFPEPIKIVINCIGFQNLSTTTSYLMERLSQRNICSPNGSGRGFVVNENFEASENFYIMGPLLAGNLNPRLRIWHAESCPRIFQLSRQLAEVLISN